MTLGTRVESRNDGAVEKKSVSQVLHAVIMAGFILASALIIALAAVIAPVFLFVFSVIGWIFGDRKANGWRPANA